MSRYLRDKVSPSAAACPYSAFTYDTRGNPAGILPGHPAIWKIDFSRDRDPKIPVRIVVNCCGEKWGVLGGSPHAKGEIGGSLISPVFDDNS